MAALWGVAAGLLVAAPLCVLLGRTAPRMGAGLAAVGGSFFLLHAAVLAARLLVRESVLPFGTLATLAFLVTVLVAALRRR